MREGGLGPVGDRRKMWTPNHVIRKILEAVDAPPRPDLDCWTKGQRGTGTGREESGKGREGGGAVSGTSRK